MRHSEWPQPSVTGAESRSMQMQQSRSAGVAGGASAKSAVAMGRVTKPVMPMVSPRMKADEVGALVSAGAVEMRESAALGALLEVLEPALLPRVVALLEAPLVERTAVDKYRYAEDVCGLLGRLGWLAGGGPAQRGAGCGLPRKAEVGAAGFPGDG